MNEVDALLEKMRSGNRRALAKLMTQIENSSEAAQGIITAVYPQTGNAHIIGITGSPGSGKSTLVTQLAKQLRTKELTVAIVAVDPSSPFSGGALLGDRIRMNELAGDKGVFIRSLASRGSLGGLTKTTNNVVKLLDAAGFDLILIETVGAGQSEVDIVHTAHTTIVIEAPGMGDEVQSIKAGILEIADILVVNKADKVGANKTVLSLKNMLHLGPAGGTRHHGQIVATVQLDEQAAAEIWPIPVLATVATKGEGIAQLVEAILAHKAHLLTHNQWFAREQARTAHEIERLIQERLLRYFKERLSEQAIAGMVTAVTKRELDAYTAVEKLLDTLIQ